MTKVNRKEGPGERRKLAEELMTEALGLEAEAKNLDDMPIELRLELKIRILLHHFKIAMNCGELEKREMLLNGLEQVLRTYLHSIDGNDPEMLNRN